MFRCPQWGSWEREVPAGQTACPSVAAAALGPCTALPKALTRARTAGWDGVARGMWDQLCAYGETCMYVLACMPAWKHAQPRCGTAQGHHSFAGLSGKGLGRMQPCMWVPGPGQAHVSPSWCRSSLPPPAPPISPTGTWCQPGMSPRQQGWGCVCTNVWFIKAFFETLALGFRLHRVAPARPWAALVHAAPRDTIQKVQTSKNRNCSTMCKNK